MTKVAYYRSLARSLAAQAARHRWMLENPSHELWSERAKTALMMMRLALNEQVYPDHRMGHVDE